MKLPRVMLSAPASGSGKTLITCGILQAFVNRGYKTASFKCGPDYIDPMFHSRVIGTESGNLDTFFTDYKTTRYLFGHIASEAEISVIEGVMGYYDGLGGISERASSADVAAALEAPVVLVVNCRGMSISVLALIKGFLEFERPRRIQGVILNQLPAGLYQDLKDEIESRIPVRVLGYVPKTEELALESRHLGLVLPDEVEKLKEKLNRLASLLEETVDLDALMAMAYEAPELAFETPKLPKLSGTSTVRIGVARDEAFCFTYRDNLHMLEQMGAELVPFSPLSDQNLPEGIQGLILSGGYPELHAARLSENQSMREEIRRAVTGGIPCIAECGGFMYLTEHIAGAPMVGLLPGGCEDKGRLVRFGYVELTARRDNLLCRAGESIRGHEFHHWDADDPGDGFTARRDSGRSWDCVVATPTLYAGFPHFHLCANPTFARNFYQACLTEKHRHTNF